MTDRKRLRPSSASDTSSLDGDLSYLDLDTGGVVRKASTPQASGTHETKTKRPSEGAVTLTNKSYDALMSKLSKMERCLTKLEKLDKLDEIENAVRRMNSKVVSFEKRLDKTDIVVSGVEKSVEFICAQYDTVCNERKDEKMKLQNLDREFTAVKSDTKELKEMLLDMQKLNSELKEEVLDLKSRSMRDNLIFTNIPERPNVDTEDVLSQFLDNKLSISNVAFERVHRIRSKNPDIRNSNKPPPIVAKFTFFKDREKVRKSGRLLKGTNYGIQEQFPEEIEKRRKPLYPLLRAARRDNKKAGIVKDRLFVEGREVFPSGDAVRPRARAQSLGNTRQDNRSRGPELEMEVASANL